MKASEITTVDDDLLKMAGDLDRLRAKLQVAEDALEKCVRVKCSGYDDSISCEECDLSCDGRCAQWMAKNALAAIRYEEIHTCPHCGRKVAVGHLLGECKGGAE